MSFNRLDVNETEIAEGSRVYFGRQGTWWDQPAGLEAYLLAVIVIALGVALGFVVT